MARRPIAGHSGTTDSPPLAVAETTPPTYRGADHSWTLQSIMELQKSVGRLTEAVDGLKEESKNQRNDLKGISRAIWIASGVIAPLIIIGGYLLDNLGNKVLTLLQNVDKLMGLVQ